MMCKTQYLILAAATRYRLRYGLLFRYSPLNVIVEMHMTVLPFLGMWLEKRIKENRRKNPLQ